MTYNNAVITLAPHGTPDPFVVHRNGKFYLVCLNHSKSPATLIDRAKTYTTPDSIQVWESDDLEGFMHTHKKIIVW